MLTAFTSRPEAINKERVGSSCFLKFCHCHHCRTQHGAPEGSAGLGREFQETQQGRRLGGLILIQQQAQ